MQQQLKKNQTRPKPSKLKILHQWARRIARLQCDHAEWWQSPSLPGGPYGSLPKKHFPRNLRWATTLSRDKGEFWTACRGMWPNMHISFPSCPAGATHKIKEIRSITYSTILKRRERENWLWPVGVAILRWADLDRAMVKIQGWMHGALASCVGRGEGRLWSGES